MTATVQPTRADLIDAVATIEAASRLVSELLHHETAGLVLTDRANHIHGRLLGEPPAEPGWEFDPDVVEVEARSAEIEADMLEGIALRESEYEGRFGRVAILRAMAPRYRERGTVELPFRLRDEVETS